MFTPSQKGSIAESAIVAAAIRLGVTVCKPINEGLRYDLVFELGGRFVRVQCKWAGRRGDVVVVPCLSRRCADGLVSKPYTPEEIDASPHIARSWTDATSCAFRASQSVAAFSCASHPPETISNEESTGRRSTSSTLHSVRLGP